MPGAAGPREGVERWGASCTQADPGWRGQHLGCGQPVWPVEELGLGTCRKGLEGSAGPSRSEKPQGKPETGPSSGTRG